MSGLEVVRKWPSGRDDNSMFYGQGGAITISMKKKKVSLLLEFVPLTGIPCVDKMKQAAHFILVYNAG